MQSRRALRHWEAPASLASWWDVLHSVSRIVFSTHSTKCWAEFRPGRLPPKRAGRDLNPQAAKRPYPCTPPRQSSVFRIVSKGPTKLWPENRGEPRPVCCCYTTANLPVGLEPTRPDPNVLQPAVGLFNMRSMAQRSCATSVFVTAFRIRGAFAPLTVDWPLCLRETLAPFTSRSPGVATLGPSCSPGRQLGCQSRPSNEVKGSDVVQLNRM